MPEEERQEEQVEPTEVEMEASAPDEVMLRLDQILASVSSLSELIAGMIAAAAANETEAPAEAEPADRDLFEEVFLGGV